MKLAEALMMRSDLQIKLDKLKQRIVNNVKIQEGDHVNEEPSVLLSEVEGVIVQINTLVKQIHATNSSTIMHDGRTLTEALADRDAIMLRKKVLDHIIETAVIKRDRYTRSEVKYVNTIHVGDMQRQIDQLSSEFRVLDTKIQEMNWTIDIA